MFPANPRISFNLHHFNPTDGLILKEAWINLWFEDDATIRTDGIFGMPITQVFTLNVSPGQTVDLHNSFSISEPIRVVALFGHRHAWTTNFSVWIEDGGQQEIIYQSFDWFDQPTYRYDSTAQNPPPQPDLRIDGGRSGLLILTPGQELHFNCHIEYTAERAALVEAPTSPSAQGSLTFTNEAFIGEMCILFGTTAGIDLGMPSPDGGAVPSFATVD